MCREDVRPVPDTQWRLCTRTPKGAETPSPQGRPPDRPEPASGFSSLDTRQVAGEGHGRRNASKRRTGLSSRHDLAADAIEMAAMFASGPSAEQAQRLRERVDRLGPVPANRRRAALRGSRGWGDEAIPADERDSIAREAGTDGRQQSPPRTRHGPSDAKKHGSAVARASAPDAPPTAVRRRATASRDRRPFRTRRRSRRRRRGRRTAVYAYGLSVSERGRL